MLEITESQLMSDPVAALEAMERMTTLGVRTSVDDFGTGYSSMSHLRRLPINEIKIDQSFVLDMTRNESDRVIVRSIIESATTSASTSLPKESRTRRRSAR